MSDSAEAVEPKGSGESEETVDFFGGRAFDFITGSLGFGMACAYMAALVFLSPQGFDGISDLFAFAWMPKVLLFATCSLVGCLLVGISKRLDSAKGYVILWICAGGGVLLSAFFPVVQPFKSIVDALAAVLLLGLWALFLLQRKMFYVFFGVAAVVAGCVMAVMAFTSVEATRLIMVACLVGSALFYTGCIAPKRQNLPFTPARETEWRGFFDLEHFLYMRVLDLILGFSIYLILSGDEPFETYLIVGVSLVFVGVGSFAASRLKVYRRQKSIVALILCFIVPAIMLLLATGFELARACGAVMFFAVAAGKMLNSMEYINRVITKPFSELFYFGTMCSIDCVTILVGLEASILVVRSTPFAAYEAVVLGALLLVLCLVRMRCFSDSEPSELEKLDPNSFWRKQVLVVAKRYNLTERQTEILYGLSRGRNARYLEEKLVISSGTVKTHIRAVYKKLDVHSQQELIDLVMMAQGEVEVDADRKAAAFRFEQES